MTYLDTMTANYPAWSWVAWVLGAILLVGGLSIWMNEVGDKRRGKVILTAVTAFIVGSVLAWAPYTASVASHQNMDNLKANIKAKYNVQDIVADYPNHVLVAGGTSQEVVVITLKGQTVMFILKQDPKTSEPTLLDSATQSGMVSSGSVTVKDITR